MHRVADEETLAQDQGDADYIMRHRLRQSALSDAQVAHEEENVI